MKLEPAIAKQVTIAFQTNIEKEKAEGKKVGIGRKRGGSTISLKRSWN